MYCDHNPKLESRNYIDGLIFTRHDPCIWVVYPPGAAGDLLISIIDRHYLRTGCEYYGINDHGRVMLYTTDYEMIDIALEKKHTIQFDDQWFYNFSDQLGRRNLTYSMLDQVIFGCHMYLPQNIQYILDHFSQSKIINIYPQDDRGYHLIKTLSDIKLKNQHPTEDISQYPKLNYQPNIIHHPRVFNLPFGSLFSRDHFDHCYAEIRKFLALAGPLICFEYIEFYLSKQHSNVRYQLQKYAQTL